MSVDLREGGAAVGGGGGGGLDSVVGNGGIIGIGGTALDERLSEAEGGDVGSIICEDLTLGGDLGPAG